MCRRYGAAMKQPQSDSMQPIHELYQVCTCIYMYMYICRSSDITVDTMYTIIVYIHEKCTVNLLFRHCNCGYFKNMAA